MPAKGTQRKLKQARLPFSPIDSKAPKKRKLSEAEIPVSSKVLRTEDNSSSKRDSDGKLLLRKSKETEVITVNLEDDEITLEEKENLQGIGTAAQPSENDLAAQVSCEESNDGIEVIAVKDNMIKGKDNLKETLIKNKGEMKKAEKSNNSKRKRTSSMNKPASTNIISKMFKNAEIKQKTASTLNDSLITKSSNEENDHSKVLESSNTSKLDEDSIEKNESLNTSSLSSKLDEDDQMEVDSNTTITSSTSSHSQKDADISLSGDTQSPKTPSHKKTFQLKTKSTPNQLKQQERMKQKSEEKLKLKLEILKLKKEVDDEKQRQKEERIKKKQEDQAAKEKEKEEKRLKIEELRLKREEKKKEEKLKKEEEKQKKEEEKQKKEEEKLKKEEEKMLAEEEEKVKQKKLKEKFAQFFVPKKVESPQVQKREESSSDNFVHFQVKDNMKIAPLVRNSLSHEKRKNLEQSLIGQSGESPFKYLKEIKQKKYGIGKSFKTFPVVEKCDEDDCEIINEEEDIDGTDVYEEKSAQTKKVKAKFLQFCENSRPAYFGTWSKKSACINGRRPFGREKIFDYDYDSDEDWEDIENGESLSDSDGEGDEGGKEEVNQYEVDNEFFVPHGYLSDGEGEDDEETEEPDKTENENTDEKEKDESLQKEKLKQKQEEFDLEMKQKMKQLKPKVFGCVWLGDKSSHQAYDQLLNILTPHRAFVMCGTCPIEVNAKEVTNEELKEDDDDDETIKKFVKNFPEKAVPDLIRLIHGNRHSKLFLMREFSEYWKKKQLEDPVVDSSNSGFIAMRKIEPKIQEIGQYGRFSENGISLKYRTWYVSKELRKKYDLEDLSMNNSWNYTLPPKEWKKDDSKEEKPQNESEEQVSKIQTKSPVTGTNLITKFTKVLSAEEEKRKFVSPSRSSPDSDASTSKIPSTPDVGASIATTPVNSGKKGKRSSSVGTKEKPESAKKVNSILTLFKKIEQKGNATDDLSSTDNSDCITLD